MRFLSIETNTQKNEATIIVQGVASKIVRILVFHSVLHSVTTINARVNLVIRPSNIVCS